MSDLKLEGMEVTVLTEALKHYGPSRVGNHTLYDALLDKLERQMGDPAGRVTHEELRAVRTAQSCSGMFLSGGLPMADPQAEVERLRRKYGMPEGTGLNLKTGEFVDRDGKPVMGGVRSLAQ